MRKAEEGGTKKRSLGSFTWLMMEKDSAKPRVVSRTGDGGFDSPQGIE